MINYNMRCIEMIENGVNALTEQDKLQHEMY